VSAAVRAYVAALSADGTKRLAQDVMKYLEAAREGEEAVEPSLQGA